MVCMLFVGVTLKSCKPSDAKIQSNVEKAIEQNYEIMITPVVSNGVVTLTGSAESAEQKMAVENTVKSVKDVKSVVNNIIVVTPAPEVVVNPDDTIISDINSKLTSGGFKGVKVEVSNGEVTLSGDIKKSDLPKVMQIANESNPKKVNNKLNLK